MAAPTAWCNSGESCTSKSQRQLHTGPADANFRRSFFSATMDIDHETSWLRETAGWHRLLVSLRLRCQGIRLQELPRRCLCTGLRSATDEGPRVAGIALDHHYEWPESGQDLSGDAPRWRDPGPADPGGVKQFFKSKGVATAAGIATVVNERNRFETFVYTNPEHRKKVQEIVEYTARNFDEIIIDDFFFTSSKSESDIQAKGDKSWTRFRLDLMAEVSRNLLLGPAKKVNPRVKMVIKYPNWYEHFQYSGYNLEDEPKIFDGVYTGTETRDSVRGNQHLQQYLGYGLVRYLENIKPGGNG